MSVFLSDLKRAVRPGWMSLRALGMARRLEDAAGLVDAGFEVLVAECRGVAGAFEGDGGWGGRVGEGGDGE